MSKNILIDSAHLEEVRVAVVDGEKLERFDFEATSRAQIKGNIYLAKVVRVEPSLQAAFVDYGCEKHGFLSFSEIHHDYFQIPVGDREDLEKHIQSVIAARASESGESEEELDSRELSKLRYQFYRRYKIQEVIKKRQIMLVQVTKEERGNKGAAITTYISLAGRYCVLMPNTAKGSGISRKIIDQNDRKKLKNIVSDLYIENGSTVIRTAGVGHSKVEIKKDFDYLKKTWDEIRQTTLKSTAPCLINEEASIIKRSIRDLYSRDIDSIIVEGKDGYKTAKSFVKKLMPSQEKKVKLYEDQRVPLFSKFKINDQINQIYSTRVDLPSGGYIVINTTEALISIDVNSGRSTRERNISGTALRTNLEAAVEIARQCRLRDLAGLIVVDFIDMEERANNGKVEKCLREALREDKAKIQVGNISNFGLLEFSRQRLRSSITEASMIVCPHCNGAGSIWSDESIALQVLRKIEETCSALDFAEVMVTVSTDVASYLMNNKRIFIDSIETRAESKIKFNIDASISAADFKIEPHLRPVNMDEEEYTSQKKENTIFNREKSGKKIVDNTKKQRNLANDTSTEEINVENGESVDQSEKQEIKSEKSFAKKRRNRNNYRRNREINRQKSQEIDSAEQIPSEQSSKIEEAPDIKSESRNELPTETKVVFSFGTKKDRKHRNHYNKSSHEVAESDIEAGNVETYSKEKVILLEIPKKKKNRHSKLEDQSSKNNTSLMESEEKTIKVQTSEENSEIQKKTKKRSGWWQNLLKNPKE